MTAAIVIPVLGRPHRIRPTIDGFTAATPEPHRLLFVASDDDEAELDALVDAGADFLTVPSARGSWGCKVNDAYRATVEDWIFAGADDLAPRAGWLSRALEWADETTGVIGTNDIANPRVMTGEHSTHTLFRRSYVDERGTIDEPGKIFHEGYRHEYADDEAIGTAKARGVYVHAFDSIVEHLHPMVGKAPDDATYRLGRAGTAGNRRLFQQRRHLWERPGPAPRARASTPAPRRGRAVVVTASYGGVDASLHPQASQDVPTDWLVFTDRADLKPPAPWRVVVVEPRFAFGGMAAKVHKATPDVEATDVIWIDGSHEITSRSFVREALAARRDGVAAFAHPRRDCIYREAEASLGAEGQGGKYADLPLLEQVAAYRAEGHPEHGGLYACGVVAWDLSDPRAREFGAKWLAECVKWSWQDQLSFPVVARRLGITPGVFPVPQIQRNGRGFLANRWLRIWAHVTAPEIDRPEQALPPPASEQTGPTPRRASSGRSSVSILVPFASDDEHRRAARDFVLDRYRLSHPGYELVSSDEPAGPDWSKGRALTELASRATGAVFVVADADSFLPIDALEAAVTRAASAPWVHPHRLVYRLTSTHTLAVLSGRAPIANGKVCVRSPYIGVKGGGIVVLTRAAWETVGGIDPRFVGWGGEDISFGWALETLVGRPETLGASLFHLWHGPYEARRGEEATEELAGRYNRARGHPDEMRAIIAERAAVSA